MSELPPASGPLTFRHSRSWKIAPLRLPDAVQRSDGAQISEIKAQFLVHHVIINHSSGGEPHTFLLLSDLRRRKPRLVGSGYSMSGLDRITDSTLTLRRVREVPITDLGARRDNTYKAAA